MKARTKGAAPKREASKATPAVQREWLRRIEAEYRSAAITHGLTGWLIQAGAPSVLIRAGLRIVGDELAHAEQSARVHAAAGGKKAPVLTVESLALARTPGAPLSFDIAMVGVRVFCLGETAAVRLFAAMRAGTTQKDARRALDRILKDEVRHRDFGWLLLDWLMTLPEAPALRAELERRLIPWIRTLRAAYGGMLASEGALEADAPRPGVRVGDADRDWGLMPAGDYVAVFDAKVLGDYERRFARAGLTLADHAAAAERTASTSRA